MNENQIRDLAMGFTKTTFVHDEIIIRQGQHPQDFFLVVEGRNDKQIKISLPFIHF